MPSAADQITQTTRKIPNQAELLPNSRVFLKSFLENDLPAALPQGDLAGFFSFFNYIPLPMILLQQNWEIRIANRAATELLDLVYNGGNSNQMPHGVWQSPLISHAQQLETPREDCVCPMCRIISDTFQTGRSHEQEGMEILSASRLHPQRISVLVWTVQILLSAGEDMVLICLEDITERKRLETALDRRLQFEQMLTNLSSRFANPPAESVDEEIRKGLRAVREFLDVDRAALLAVSSDKKRVWVSHADTAEGVALPVEIGANIAHLLPLGYETTVEKGLPISRQSLSDLPTDAHADRETLRRWRIESMLTIPLNVGDKLTHLITVNCQHPRIWPEDYIPRLSVLGKVFAEALARRQAEEQIKRSYHEIQELKDRLQAEADYLQSEMDLSQGHGNIIVQSQAMRDVVRAIQQVAPTDSLVLIQGETGTGKELVAKAIYSSSKRRDRPWIKVDCGALPASLIESELFGREKGAYTGALARQVGRFEIANGGTIFLDEIGELPLEAQTKLLRVLQEGEFERLGSPRTVRVDVRVIAATNRNLADDVRNGKFREDLFYRLNVFPITVPPLRDRIEDIPLLVWAFIGEFNIKMGRRVQAVSQKSMDLLQEYPWPGNVRQLRNMVEQSFIMSSGSRLDLKTPVVAPGKNITTMNFEDNERQLIQSVLRRTNGRIKGPGGAAVLLGLKPSTVYCKMKRLGISPRGANSV